MSSESHAFSFGSLWTHSLQAPAVGLALARENGRLVVWDRNHWLYLFNRAGSIQGQVHLPEGVIQACLADDSSAILVALGNGTLRMHGPDLSVRWETRLAHRPLAAALEHLGEAVTAGDDKGNICLFRGDGQRLWTMTSPRPLLHLEFVPGRQTIAASADFGLTGMLDKNGTWVWRDTPIVNVGDVSVSGDAGTLLLACYSDGLHRYRNDGRNADRLRTAQPVRYVAQSYGGERIVVAGVSPWVALLDRDGAVLAQMTSDQPVAGLALDALGETACACLGDGSLLKWTITRSSSAPL